MGRALLRIARARPQGDLLGTVRSDAFQHRRVPRRRGAPPRRSVSASVSKIPPPAPSCLHGSFRVSHPRCTCSARNWARPNCACSCAGYAAAYARTGCQRSRPRHPRRTWSCRCWRKRPGMCLLRLTFWGSAASRSTGRMSMKSNVRLAPGRRRSARK
jgi:hypothetical protein